MLQITSEKLQVLVHEKGAELLSVKDKQGLEFLWQADPAVWPRHAPVLFPIVGRLREDNYTANGRSYSLGQHGFARDREFRLISHTTDSCVFELTDDETSLAVYPFSFMFRISHSLQAGTLRTQYDITNTSTRILEFSVGAHPGFNCVLSSGETIADFDLEFDHENLNLSLLENGLRSGLTKPLKTEKGRLKLETALFDQDALVFENNQIDHLVLRSRRSGHTIEMHCKDWPYFGIWTKKGCDKFVCLEPWYGIADSAEATGELSHKQGIIKLAPGSSFSCAFSVTFS